MNTIFSSWKKIKNDGETLKVSPSHLKMIKDVQRRARTPVLLAEVPYRLQGSLEKERRIAAPVCALARNDKCWGRPLRTVFAADRFGMPLGLAASECLWGCPLRNTFGAGRFGMPLGWPLRTAFRAGGPGVSSGLTASDCPNERTGPVPVIANQ